MRYSQDREKSAELLRLVLPLMAQHSAALHPSSYAVWYEHLAGINPGLSKALNERLESDAPLVDEEVHRLHAQHIMARDMEVLEELQKQLGTLLVETARSAANAEVEAGQFGQSLEQHKAHLAEAIGSVGVRRVVAELLTDTAQIQAVTQALSQRLEASAQEVNALNERLERAQAEALLDPLTGLNNRRGLERALEDTLNAGLKLLDSALLLADIDYFKEINDTYGHLLGDKVIRAVAQRLQENVKGRDIAARIGGEEFAILLPQTSLAGAMALAEQIRTAVSRVRIHRGNRDMQMGSVTISIGVAVARPGENLYDLIERADHAMYAAKHGGRNRVCQAP